MMSRCPPRPGDRRESLTDCQAESTKAGSPTVSFPSGNRVTAARRSPSRARDVGSGRPRPGARARRPLGPEAAAPASHSEASLTPPGPIPAGRRRLTGGMLRLVLHLEHSVTVTTGPARALMNDSDDPQAITDTPRLSSSTPGLPIGGNKRRGTTSIIVRR
jgi:hypothetical protein